MATYPAPAPLLTPANISNSPDVLGEPPPKAEIDIPLKGVRLTDLTQSARAADLDRMEQYYRGSQDDGKRYDWDGNIMGYGGDADIKPGWYVPMKMRRPCARYDLGKLIVTRLTAMVFGEGRFPELRIEGDEEAEDYVRALCEASRLRARMIEARNLGGATGTAVLSFCFKDGMPRVEAHNSKHVTVLRWEDEDERIVGAALKTYAYSRAIYDASTGKVRQVNYYYARYWDTEREIVWEPIPQSIAQTAGWQSYPSRSVTHAFEFCPLYWIQNLPDSEQPDGESDYDGLTGNFDELNQLLSAKTRGVKANCDPTLVVRMDPAMNDGSALRKGSENALFSPQGADYLTLSGDAVAAVDATVEKLRAYCLDTASVVLADPEKLSGAAQSAQALRILYAPMLAKCDLLREQYTTFGLQRVLLGMLEAARRLHGNVVVDETTGETIAQAINLPPRAVSKLAEEAEEEAVTEMVERTPGQSSNLELIWAPYFTPTWGDIKAAAEAVKTANGGKPTISQRSGIAAVQHLFGIGDAEEEQRRMDEEAEVAIQQAQRAMMAGPEPDYTSEDGGFPDTGTDARDEGDEDED